MSLSMVAAGITCIFAALCYAEFAAMVPVAGSAYTYAYATLGELFAWIIGWDLVLEYAVGPRPSPTAGRTTSRTCSRCFNGGKSLWPAIISQAPFDYKKGEFLWTGAYFDLPAIVIVAIITLTPRAGDQGERQLQRRHGDRQAFGRLLRDRRRGLLCQPRELEALRTLRLWRAQLLRHAGLGPGCTTDRSRGCSPGPR